MFQKFTKIIEIKSRSKIAQPVLSLIAFCESIFFPVPPDTILIPIIYFNKKKYLFTIINCTLFSVGGGIIGYFLGFFIFDLIKEYIDVGKQSSFLKFYNEWGIVAVFLGGFTPIPYKIIALTSGYSKFNFLLFVILSMLSRGLRFFIIGFIIKKYGDFGINLLKKNKLLIFFLIPLLIIGLIYLGINHA